MSAWTLRPMTLEDVDAVWAGEQEPSVAAGLIHALPAREEIAARLLEPPEAAQHHVACGPRGEVAGYLEVRPISLHGVSCGSFSVWVLPAWRRQGIAEALVAEAEARARARWGLEAMLIGVFEDNAGARALYARRGYLEVDRQWWWPSEGPRRRVLLLSNRPAPRWTRRAGFGTPPGA